jgi:hypothetical protein
MVEGAAFPAVLDRHNQLCRELAGLMDILMLFPASAFPGGFKSAGFDYRQWASDEMTAPWLAAIKALHGDPDALLPAVV